MAVTHDMDDYDPEPRFGRDPRPERRGSVSVTLRHAREDHGQDVRSIAQVLRIRQAYLEALESGDFERLPGTAYALGFLRTYAEFLGLDGDEIVDRFKAEVEGAERRTELIFPEPVTEGRIPGGAIILISVILLALAYAGWFYLSNQGRTIADLIPALPAQLQALLDSGGKEAGGSADAPATEAASTPATNEEPAAELAPAPEAATPEPALPDATRAAASGSAEPPAIAGETAPAAAPSRPEVPPIAAAAVPPAPAVSAPAEQVRAPAEPAVGAADRVDTARVAVDAPGPSGPADPPGAPGAVDPASLVEQTVVIPAPPSAPQTFAMPSEPTPRVYGESNDSGRIVLRAVQDSWVQVRDNQDALLMTRVLRTGDVYYVPDQDGLTLLTGNAGGIQIEVDGVTLPAIGPLGAVRRQIALDPARLLDGTAGAR